MNDRKRYDIYYTYSYDIAQSCNFKKSDIVYTTRNAIKIGELINFSGRTCKVINIDESEIKHKSILGDIYIRGKIYIQYL